MMKFLDYDEAKDKCVSCRIELSHCKLIFDKKPTGERSAGNVVLQCSGYRML